MRCLSLSLVLQFDGSLRQPRDAGFSSADLGRMASGSAAIILSNNHKPLALGGKLLGSTSMQGITSAHAEYEGLLLGLRWLACQTEEWWDAQSLDERQLTIQGDCRTVIDQLLGVSEPRKLRQKYNEASQLIEKLSERTGSEILCQRIVREENGLCDSICRSATESLQLKTMLDVHSAMMETTKVPLRDCIKSKKAQSSPLTDILTAYMHENSLVKHSIRPLLYREASLVAQSLGDGMAKKTIGELMANEAKFWPSINQPDNEKSDECRESLSAEGIKLQIDGLNEMALHKEASRLKQKHRHILRKFGNNQALSESSPVSQHSFIELAHLAYQRQIESLEGEPSPLLSAWHMVAFQQIVDGNNERQADQDLDQDIWIEKMIADPVANYR